MRSSSPPTWPSSSKAIFFSFRPAIVFLRLSGATEIMMRDCASLNKTSAVVAGLSPGLPRRRPLQLTLAPNKPSGLKQHSASATAIPPSLQSCALLTRPPRISSRTASWTAISAARSSPALVLLCDRDKPLKISTRRCSVFRGFRRRYQNDRVACRFEPLRRNMRRLIDQSDHADSRGGIDHAPGALIIERDIAAYDGGVEGAAGFGQAFDRLAQLPEILGFVRVPEV